jgi:hypothetical protein
MRYRDSPIPPSPSILLSRQVCPECHGQMFLRRVEPDVSDHDRRTYECAMCDHTETRVVKYR